MKCYGIHRTGCNACAAPDTLFFVDPDAGYFAPVFRRFPAHNGALGILLKRLELDNTFIDRFGLNAPVAQDTFYGIDLEFIVTTVATLSLFRRGFLCIALFDFGGKIPQGQGCLRHGLALNFIHLAGPVDFFRNFRYNQIYQSFLTC